MRRLSRLIAAIVSCMPWLAHAQGSPSVTVHIAHIESDIRPLPLFRGSPSTTIDARMHAWRVPAVSIAVIDSGRIVWTKAYGVADAGTGLPATSSTRFQAGSMSKPVAAVATLRLVEQGKLSLDADVNATLRSWKIPPSSLGATPAVTLRMLLGHSAGLTVHGFPGYAAGAPLPSVPQVLDGTPPANTPAVRIDAMPGTIWRYSGGGITVVQLLMTDVTGEDFPALVRRLVLDPAHMTSSGYEQPLPDSLIGDAASGHHADGTPVPGRWHTYPEMMAAGLWTTPTDLARYIIELQHAYAGTSSLITQATARAMVTPGLGGWGLGIQVAGSGDSLRFMHGGDNDGFHGEFIGYVRGGRGIVVMTNGDGA
jgi:CubicO group peptidase (beta-lactamase class C family)